MKNTRDLFRENLREIITPRGLKLEAVAADCEISLSTLNQILSGKIAYSPETIDKICKGLKISQADLFAVPATKKDEKLAEKPEPLELIQKDIQDIKAKLNEKQSPDEPPGPRRKLNKLIASLPDSALPDAIHRIEMLINGLREDDKATSRGQND